ncbi:hypothetical protein ACH5RR_032060 [Cinchona calisaya]|uniref:Uncharacterized protein n=1 Tax=Cinchona calisaya TaxID=153742 RepID=A0ABD2YI37_9GENT
MDAFNEELPALRKSACFENMDQISNPLPQREVSTNSSQRSNVSSCQRIEYSGEKFAVGEPAVSVELGNMKTNSSQLQENPCDGETDEKWSSNDVNCIGARSSGNMTVVADKSMMAEKESQETEQSDKSWGITHPAIKLSGNHIVMNRTGNDTIGTDNFKRSEKEVEETENSNILDIHSSVNQLANCVHVDYIGEEGIDIDNSMRVEKEVEDTDKSDTCEITYSTIKELRNSINANSSGKETIGADNSKRIKKLVEDTEKFDKSCKTIHLTVKTLSNENSEDSKENPTNEHQISSFTPGKRQKMGEHGIVMNFQKDGDETKNADVPIQVYHHQKRKISMESDACASAGGGINVEGAGTPNSNTGEIREGMVTGNDINWTIPSDLNTTHVADYAAASFEPNDRNIETLRASLASKDIAITQAALGVLYRKMAKLCQQHQLIQDDIALCDRNIQNILQGNEGASTLKVDSTMDGCKDTCFSDKIQDESYQHGEGCDLIQSTKGKRIPDAVLYLRSPRQDLDDICRENNWTVLYNISALDGGFVAKITVEGMDIDCSYCSQLLSTPEEAREAAAAQIITELLYQAKCY